MHCPACGNQVDFRAAFCPTCGHRLQDNVALRVQPLRPAVITVLAVFQFLVAAACTAIPVGVIVAILASTATARPDNLTFAIVVLLVFVGLAVMQVACGIGLLKLKRYGRTLLRFQAIIGLLGIPVGTIISIIILVYLNTPGIKVLFSERPVQDLTTDEYTAVTASTTSTAAAMVVVILGVVVFGIIGLGIVAAIVVPGLLRARLAANEASAIASLRSFASAEASYAEQNGGRYGSPECLVTPDRCLPGYKGLPFHPPPLERTFQKRGYVFMFLSPETVDPQGTLDPPARRIERYVMLALPMQANVTGQRVFCVDATGVAVWATDVQPPSGMLASCPAQWTPVSVR